MIHPHASSIAAAIGSGAAITQTVKVRQLKNTTASAKSPSQTQSNQQISYVESPLVRKVSGQWPPERAMNVHTILKGDNAMIAMTENGTRPHASGTTIKAPIIVPSGTLRQFVVLRVVLVEISLLKPGLATRCTSVSDSDTVVITVVNRPHCTTSSKYYTTEKLQ